MLISGELHSFVLPHIEKFQDFRSLAVIDSHVGGRLRNGPASKNPCDAQRLAALKYTVWHRCRHLTTGGLTDYVCLFGYTNLSQTPATTKVRRDINHIFNAGVRPGPPPKDLPSERYGSFYMMSDRLQPSLYHLPVLCPH